MGVYVPTQHPLFTCPRVAMSGKLKKATWSVCAAAGVAGVLVGGAHTGNAGADLRQMPAYRQPVAAPVLAAASVSLDRKYGFITVTGEADNLARKPVANVEAVVELFDGAGRLLKTESALVSLPSIAGGEESPFQIATADPGGVTSYRVRFRHLLGVTIPSR